ncbi:putative ribonuclease H-like domain-containing protein [Tanacetum coccineum]
MRRRVPTNFAIMAYSLTSSSSSTNSEVSNDSNCCSSCLECVKDPKEQNEQLVKDLRTAMVSVVSCKTDLESVEARLYKSMLCLTSKARMEDNYWQRYMSTTNIGLADPLFYQDSKSFMIAGFKHPKARRKRRQLEIKVDNDEGVGEVADMNNLDAFYTNQSIPLQEYTKIIHSAINHKDFKMPWFACFLSQEEPKKVIHALKDPSWIKAMQDELLQFKLQKVWTLVDLPNKKGLLGLNGFTGTRRIKEMDVKSVFLYGKIEEKVYVCQPPRFEDPDFLDRVYKVEKALHRLHQAPKAWYETLSTYLLDNGFQRGKIDKTLFIKRVKSDILLVQVYVDDIIFGSTKKSLCIEFEKMMHMKFQMSSMGELIFFQGLQVKQKEDGIFISQDKYVTKILKKFGFTDVKTTSTPMETHKPLLKDADCEDVDEHMYRSMIGSLMYLTSSRPDIMFAVCTCLWYLKDSPFDLVAYTGSDYAGASLDKKSTTGEAEYVDASSCCDQVLWIQNQLMDYGYNFMQTKIHIDNESTICIVKNPVFHLKTKHIKIRHYFIKDSNDKKLIQMIKIYIDQNVTDLLTKAFDVSRFKYPIASIGMLNL